ncbi:MAG: type I methionyl aminopeptidase [Alphaproteobacteria bacterium]|nr:type I methionyl aminopeptidase [Alphaproteobacteria bacterium]
MNYIAAQDAPLRNDGLIKLHGPAAFAGMRAAGRLAAETLDMIGPHVEPGVTTGELDALCHAFIVARGGVSAPLNYRGYPKTTCISLNHVVCHGIPGERKLRDSDILNIDVTPLLDGWHGDSSRMFVAGEPSVRARRLIEVTYQSLMYGCAAAKPGATTGDIGHAIQFYAEANRFSVVRDFCGHGTGQVFHDAPNIMHFGVRGSGVTLKPGMIFTIEPMINAGKFQVKILGDGWTAVTRDKSLSAQFEHSIGITETGCEIFTTSPRGLHLPKFD